MKRIILADSNHSIVKQKAVELVAGSTSNREKIEKIFEYVRDSIQFGFPLKGDFVSASETIQTGVGQCNTKSTLFIALCRAIGISAHIHFSTIKKEIQRGLFTGIAYRLMPDTISHSWVEVQIDGVWRRIDSYINDMNFYVAGKNQLKKMNWNTGFSISCTSGDSSANLHLDKEKFVQMDAVLDDHGIWDEPMDYYRSPEYKNRLGFIKMLMYRLMIGRINHRVAVLRKECVPSSSGLCGI